MGGWCPPILSLMRLGFLIICFLASTHIIAQQKSVVYNAVYETEIKTKANIKVNEKQPLSKQDSLLSDFTKLFIEELGRSGLNVKLIDSLMHYNDTTFIKTVTDQDGSKGNRVSVDVKLENNSMFLVKGKFWIRSNDSLGFRLVSGHYEKFVFLEKGEQILGYDTDIYINDPKSIRIWVAETLPATINPKIKIADPKGAILKYEVTNENQVSSSVIKDLKKGSRENQKI